MIALINGKRRKGKSTLAYHLAQERARAIVVWDPNTNFKSPEYVICYSIDELESAFNDVREETFFGDTKTEQKPFTIVYVPPEDFTEEDFKNFSDVVRRWMRGTYALILDESDEEIQRPSRMCKALAWWIRRSPQDPPEVVHVIQATHTPKDVNTKARDLLTDLYVFQTDGQASLDWYEEYTELPGIREQIRNLPHRAVLHYYLDLEGNPVVEVWDNPQAWYVDIGSDRSKIPLDKRPEKRVEGSENG